MQDFDYKEQIDIHYRENDSFLLVVYDWKMLHLPSQECDIPLLKFSSPIILQT